MNARRRTNGRSIAVSVAAGGVLLVVALLLACRDELLEQWEYWRHDGVTYSRDWTPREATCESDRIRRRFRILKRRFLVGEPLLVEFRIDVNGPGGWMANRLNRYKGRNRDFCLLLRHENGEWAPDRFEPRSEYFSGGAGPLYEVSREKPDVYWLAAQEYCRIGRPGTYWLYCLRQNFSEELEADAAIPSFLGNLPPAVLERAAQMIPPESFEATSTVDQARFLVRIDEGSAAERRAMVEHWRGLARDWLVLQWPITGDPSRAALLGGLVRGLGRSLRNDFLDWYEEALPDPFIHEDYSPAEARRRRFFICAESERWKGERLDAEELERYIPEAIEQLAAADASARSLAFFHLRLWSGESFGHAWEGHVSSRPTPGEGRRMQPAWRDWWARRFRPSLHTLPPYFAW